MSDIVQKLWGFCHTLRHDGVDYGDYIEQLTYLLFLKMADERAVEIPKGCDWSSLKELSGTALTDHYNDVLRKLRSAEGLLGDIKGDFRSFLSTASGFGTVGVTNGKPFLNVVSGTIEVRTIDYNPAF